MSLDASNDPLLNDSNNQLNNLTVDVATLDPISTYSDSLIKKPNPREIIKDFYILYNPEKVDTLNVIFDKYENNEIQLMKHLKEKYEVVDYEPFDSYIAAYQPSNSNNQSSNMTKSNSGPIGVIPGLNNINVPGISNDLAQRFLTGWNTVANSSTNTINSSSPTINKTKTLSSTLSSASLVKQGENSSSDEISYANKIKTLEADISTLESEKTYLESSLKMMKTQNSALKSENTKIKSEMQELTQRVETASRSLVSVVDRETTLTKENQSLSEKLKYLENYRSDMDVKYDLIVKQKASKHKQLLECIKLTHKLGAQVRFLATKAYSGLESSNQVQISNDINISQKINQLLANNNTNNNNNNANSNTNPSSPRSNNKITTFKSHCKDCEVYAFLCSNIQEYDVINNLLHDLTLSTDTLPKNDIANEDIFASIATDISNGNINQEILLLKHSLKVLHSAYIGSRVELRCAIEEASQNEKRTIEQQTTIESIQAKLNKVVNELQTASGSADSLKKQINDAHTEIEKYKTQKVILETKTKEAEDKVRRAHDEISRLKEALLAATTAKHDLAEIYSQHIKNSEKDSMDYMQALSERLLLEREEMIIRMSQVFDKDREVKIAFQHEIQREMAKLRDELFKSRRSEAQREREIAFLQSQLIDAVDRISILDGKLRELEDIRQQYDELQHAIDMAKKSQELLLHKDNTNNINNTVKK